MRARARGAGGTRLVLQVERQSGGTSWILNLRAAVAAACQRGPSPATTLRARLRWQGADSALVDALVTVESEVCACTVRWSLWLPSRCCDQLARSCERVVAGGGTRRGAVTCTVQTEGDNPPCRPPCSPARRRTALALATNAMPAPCELLLHRTRRQAERVGTEARRCWLARGGK
ncbi:hypothetical protein EON67_04180 [archaeon]|nr:MAG: hypothetical protein EON67_04180 [archaeon]